MAVPGLEIRLPSGWEVSHGGGKEILLRKPAAGVGMYFPTIRVAEIEPPQSLDEMEREYRSMIGESQWKGVSRVAEMDKRLHGVPARGFTRRFENSAAAQMWRPGDDPKVPLKMDYMETTVFIRTAERLYEVRFGSARSLYEGVRPEFDRFLESLTFVEK